MSDEKKENDKKKLNPVVTIAGIILILLFILVNIPKELLNFFAECKNIETIRFIIDLLYCALIITITFKSVLVPDNKKCYYYLFHVLYSLLPLALVWQYVSSGKKSNIIILFIFLLFIACYICCKVKKVKEADLQYIKYSRLLISAIFTIIFSVGDLFFEEKLKILHFVFFTSPFLILKVIYEKAILDIKKTNCENTKND
jgi:hypothetical protein